MPKKPLDLKKVLPEISQIDDDVLRSQVENVWQALWQESEWETLESVPTSREIPYSNLPHTRAVVQMALAVAAAFEANHGVSVNKDVLVAAALLQDVSKLVELRPGPGGTVEKTERGKLFQHPFLGAHSALEAGVPAEVVHIILTHSPTASSFPDSLEGKILYYVDQLDVLAIHKDRWKKSIVISK